VLKRSIAFSFHFAMPGSTDTQRVPAWPTLQA
jgi:hypothetical protein